jgi:hypothetical protein
MKSVKWNSTKFLQAAFVQLTGAIALFMRIIDGGTYVALSTIALAVYGAANVASDMAANQRTRIEGEVTNAG